MMMRSLNFLSTWSLSSKRHPCILTTQPMALLYCGPLVRSTCAQGEAVVPSTFLSSRTGERVIFLQACLLYYIHGVFVVLKKISLGTGSIALQDSP